MKQLRNVGYNTDRVMKMTWLTLCDDFGITGFQPIRAALARGDIRAFREECSVFRQSYGCEAYDFKRTAQLLGWLKRYRFANDLFSDEQLAQVSWMKYSETQVRCAAPIPVDKFYRSGLVQRWRAIASSILGEYTEAEHFERCTFAKNACVGHPSRRKGLDQKLKGPITGSMEHIRFLQRYAETDPTLAGIIQEMDRPFHPVPSLRLTFVPKSFKALRAIMPDTLAGSFYSSGLGKMIEDRLKKAGINIRTLQRKHRRKAMQSSRTTGWVGQQRTPSQRLATADLSSASDSITTQLLSMILPRKWFKAVTRGRIATYSYDSRSYHLTSACTMGLGHTFPLETLVFYVLTKGVAEWYGPKAASEVSVYGDDILVQTGVLVGDGKPSLVSIFRMLHLLINDDKSFWGWCDFRESCGGDFYRGHDVRPASPEGESTCLSKNTYVTFLYKLANSLLRRWDASEIENTLAWITLEIEQIDGVVLAVPPSFPDTSGLKVEPGTWSTNQVDRVNFGSFAVDYYQVELGSRRVFFETPLLWNSLRERPLIPRPWSLKNDSYEATKGQRVRRRKVKTRKGYKIISFLIMPDPSSVLGAKPAKSVCPQWR